MCKQKYMQLYIRPSCPFCVNVLDFAEERGIELEIKDIGDAAIAEELIARGGKQQVPYLVDEKEGVEMYESDAIIAYLGDASTMKTDINSTVCPL
jgi:glutaredoxin 3